MAHLKKFQGYFKPYNKVKTPLIMQHAQTECGIASLAMLMAYYKVKVPMQELRDLSGVNRDGCTMPTLMALAIHYGFEARAYRVDLTTLNQLSAPILAFWNFSHYIVIKGLGRHGYFVNDPAIGSILVKPEEMSLSFTGIILVITPTNLSNIRQTPPRLKFAHSDVHYKITLFLFSCLVIIMASTFLNTYCMQVFIQFGLLQQRHWVGLIFLISTVSSLILLRSIWAQRYAQFKLSVHKGILQAKHLIQHSLKLPLNFYALRQKTDLLFSITQAETNLQALTQSLITSIISLIILVICIIGMVSLDAYLSFLSILLSVIFSYFYLKTSQVYLQLERQNLYKVSKLFINLSSSLKNLETLKACSLETKTLKKLLGLFFNKYSAQAKIKEITALQEIIISFHDTLSLLCLLSLGANRITQGNISLAKFMAYLGVYRFFQQHLLSLTNCIKEYQNAYAANLRISEIENTPQATQFLLDKAKISREKHNTIGIECDNISFFFNRNALPTLRNITLHIKPKEHIALIGKTGSGKSSLGKILAGLYTVAQGELRLASINIQKLSSQEISQHIAYLSQDVALFSGSIYDNLTLWTTSYSAEEIASAIQLACLEPLITERGLHGIVEEGGRNFSGGEKQLLEIARVLLQKTPILILDEASSALDVQTEAKLMRNLLQLDKTLILIAHRLSTIAHCNHIVVMDQGSIIEQGHPTDLLQQQGHYYRLLQSESTHLDNEE